MPKTSAIYPWCNPGDPDWRTRRSERMLSWGEGVEGLDTSVCRYSDHGELKWSLRGIHSFMPWIDEVVLVLDSEAPAWLNPDAVRIVRHEEIFKTANLPCFNAAAISCVIDRIPGLDRFLICNDDVFFGPRAKERDWFDRSGKPIASVTGLLPTDGDTIWERKLVRTRDAIKAAGIRRPLSMAHHARSSTAEVHKASREVFGAMLEHGEAQAFRCAADTAATELALNLGIDRNKVVNGTRDLVFRELTGDMGKNERAFMGIAHRRPKYFCLNDCAGGRRQEITSLFDRYFPAIYPEKSRFEL